MVKTKSLEDITEELKRRQRNWKRRLKRRENSPTKLKHDKMLEELNRDTRNSKRREKYKLKHPPKPQESICDAIKRIEKEMNNRFKKIERKIESILKKLDKKKDKVKK